MAACFCAPVKLHFAFMSVQTQVLNHVVTNRGPGQHEANTITWSSGSVKSKSLWWNKFFDVLVLLHKGSEGQNQDSSDTCSTQQHSKYGTLTLTFNSWKLNHLSPSECLCQIWQISIKVLLRYCFHQHGLDRWKDVQTQTLCQERNTTVVENIQAKRAHERGCYPSEDSDHLRAIYELHHESFTQTSLSLNK